MYYSRLYTVCPVSKVALGEPLNAAVCVDASALKAIMTLNIATGSNADPKAEIFFIEFPVCERTNRSRFPGGKRVRWNSDDDADALSAARGYASSMEIIGYCFPIFHRDCAALGPVPFLLAPSRPGRFVICRTGNALYHFCCSYPTTGAF